MTPTPSGRSGFSRIIPRSVGRLRQTCGLARFVLALAVGLCLAFGVSCAKQAPVPVGLNTDDALLEEIQKRCFDFFWEQADPDTGLIVDRAHADGGNRPRMGSIAATGFGLTAVAIADERGWVEHGLAYERVLTTLRYLWDDLPNKHGWYYHFIDIRDGDRLWKSEVSSIDTALLMCGVLTVRQAYPDTEVAELATKIYERIDFPWMTNGEATLSMGWKPEPNKVNKNGFLPQHWNEYSEHLVLSLLAMGSTTHPLPPEHWHGWTRSEVYDYKGKRFFGSTALFTHQYSHAYVDLRGKRDEYADYWHNSVLATIAQQEMCAQQLSRHFPHYNAKVWGISASDFVDGYTGWGGPPATTNIDGTVVPYAVAGALPFTPELAMTTLRHLATEHADEFWTRYGPSSAFNPAIGWKGDEVLGIDAGITFVMIENHRTGRPWELFMANPEIRNAMNHAGFRPLTAEENDPTRASSLFKLGHKLPIPAEALTDARFGTHDADVLPLDAGWDSADWQELRIDNALEWGQPTNRHQLTGRFAFMWDDDALHLRVHVNDDEIVNDEDADELHQGDSVEIFLDPDHDGMVWRDTDDFRIGVAPTGQRYEWFGQRVGFGSVILVNDDGYELRCTFPWKFLGHRPRAGQTLGGTVALKSVDEVDGLIRLNWAFQGKKPPIFLGNLHLR